MMKLTLVLGVFDGFDVTFSWASWNQRHYTEQKKQMFSEGLVGDGPGPNQWEGSTVTPEEEIGKFAAFTLIWRRFPM